MKVRIHQLAKDLDKTTKDILTALETLGVKGLYHTSSIDEEWIPKIKKLFRIGKAKGVTEKPRKRIARETPSKAALAVHHPREVSKAPRKPIPRSHRVLKKEIAAKSVAVKETPAEEPISVPLHVTSPAPRIGEVAVPRVTEEE